jgi:hypothetical protein
MNKIINILFIPIILFWQVVGTISGIIFGTVVGIMSTLVGFKKLHAAKISQIILKQRVNRVKKYIKDVKTGVIEA